MKTGSALEALAAAIHAACLRDLPIIRYRDRDWEAYRKHMDSLTREQRAAAISAERTTGELVGPFIDKERRPHRQEVAVLMFEQTWPSTALGYGGMGGASMTSAYTVLVQSTAGDVAVYFGDAGRLAYVIPAEHARDQMHQIRAQGAAPSAADARGKGWMVP